MPTGAVLVYDGEVLTAGDVPSTEARALAGRLGRDARRASGVFASASLARDVPAFADARRHRERRARRSNCRARIGEYLLWLRGEQVREVRWAGNPHKPVLPGNDPRDLSPRRSFAVWTERVRGTCAAVAAVRAASRRAPSARRCATSCCRCAR